MKVENGFQKWDSVSEWDYNMTGFTGKENYNKVFQVNTNLSIHGHPNFVDTDESIFNKYNSPYRRIIYRLKEVSPVS